MSSACTAAVVVVVVVGGGGGGGGGDDGRGGGIGDSCWLTTLQSCTVNDLKGTESFRSGSIRSLSIFATNKNKTKLSDQLKKFLRKK